MRAFEVLAVAHTVVLFGLVVWIVRGWVKERRAARKIRAALKALASGALTLEQECEVEASRDWRGIADQHACERRGAEALDRPGPEAGANPPPASGGKGGAA